MANAREVRQDESRGVWGNEHGEDIATEARAHARTAVALGASHRGGVLHPERARGLPVRGAR